MNPTQVTLQDLLRASPHKRARRTYTQRAEQSIVEIQDDSLTHLLRANPKQVKLRTERVGWITRGGSHDVEHAMEQRKRTKQYQPSSVRFLNTTLEVAGTYKTKPNPKHAGKHRKSPDAKMYATTLVTYPAHVAHYFWQHDATHYMNVFTNGAGYAKVDATAILLQAANNV